MFKKTWFTVGVVTLSLLGLLVPSTVFARDGLAKQESGSVQQQQGLQEGPAYDAKSEATFNGTIADVKSGRSALYWFLTDPYAGPGAYASAGEAASLEDRHGDR